MLGLPGGAGDAAVGCGEEVVSYGELESVVGGLAGELAARGAGRGSRIGVCVRRGVWSVAGMLACWRAGAAYVPLDPGFPAERLRFMVGEAGVGWVVADAVSVPAVSGLGAETVLVGAVRPAPGTPGAVPGPGDLAYVIFTSGSTGRPKAVGVEHSALARHVAAARDLFGVTAADRVLAFASFPLMPRWSSS